MNHMELKELGGAGVEIQQKFHISTVMSLIVERIISNRNEIGLFEIVDFMSRGHLPGTTEALFDKAKECKAELLRQFPQLGTPEMKRAIAEYEEMCKPSRDEDDPRVVTNKWLAKLVTGEYGVSLDEFPVVAQLPRKPLQHKAVKKKAR